MLPQLQRYWDLKDLLYVLDGVILLKDKVIIPPLRNQVTSSYTEGRSVCVIIPVNLRPEVMQSLHADHQGVSPMIERAKVAVS